MTLLRPCATPRCPELVQTSARFCEPHRLERGARDRQRRDTTSAQGYGTRWQKLRLVILARDPICTHCQAAPSTEVDHIERKRLEVDGADCTPEELQGLCKRCHSQKTRAESRGLRGQRTCGL